MALFVAAAAALLILAVILAHELRRPADTLGLRAARAEIVADLHHRARQERNRDLVALRVPASLRSEWAERVDAFHREDR